MVTVQETVWEGEIEGSYRAFRSRADNLFRLLQQKEISLAEMIRIHRELRYLSCEIGLSRQLWFWQSNSLTRAVHLLWIASGAK